MALDTHTKSKKQEIDPLLLKHEKQCKELILLLKTYKSLTNPLKYENIVKKVKEKLNLNIFI